jgi:hypothetical protein
MLGESAHHTPLNEESGLPEEPSTSELDPDVAAARAAEAVANDYHPARDR